MYSKVSSDWLPSYIKATQPVLEIFRMAGYFADSPRRSQCDVSHNLFAILTVLPLSSLMIFSQQYIFSQFIFSQSLERFQAVRFYTVASGNLSNKAHHIQTFHLLHFAAYQVCDMSSNMTINKKGKAVPGHIIQACRRRRGIAILILNPRIRWRQVVNFKEQLGHDADPSPPSSIVGHERVELYLYSPYGPYGLYRASVPVQGCKMQTFLN
jgi:hypothetical protein